MREAPERPLVLIVGIGEVGRYLLEFLAREEQALAVAAADVRAAAVEAQVDNARFGAALHRRYPRIEAFEIDLFDVERTAGLLERLRPEVVVNCAVLQTWHAIRRLPEEIYSRLSAAGLGAWLPVQLTLAMKLAEAIRMSGISTRYVNTSLSDLTNPVLRAMGMAPTIGIGNVALIATALQFTVARELTRAPSEVSVKLVAHHVHWVTWREAGYREGAPIYMRLEAAGEEVTGRFDTLDLMRRSILRYPTGTSFSAVSASSALHNVRALLSTEPVATHSPGPNGLPGGYPVVLSRRGAALDLPIDLTPERAVAINEEAQTYDGVERVDADARVHFMPYAIEIMRDVLGFDCDSFVPSEAAELAHEQMRRFAELEKRYS